MRKLSLFWLFILVQITCIGQFQQIDINITSSILLCPDSTVTITNIGNITNNPDIRNTSNYIYPFEEGKVNGLDKVISISAGYLSNYFLRLDSTVWAMGYNYLAQQGIGTIDDEYHSIHKIEGLKKITKIKGGIDINAALDADEHVWIWGGFTNNQEGYSCNDSDVFCTPYKLNIENVSDVSLGTLRILILCNDGKVWQRNNYFNDTAILEFEESVNIKNISKISCGLFTYYALTTSGDLLSWNNSNEMPDTIDHNVCLMDAGRYDVFYLKTDGTLWYIDEEPDPLNDIQTKIDVPFEIKSIINDLDYFVILSKDNKIFSSYILPYLYTRGDTVKFSELIPVNWNCFDCSSVITETTIFEPIINPNADTPLEATKSTGNKYLWFPLTGFSNPFEQVQYINTSSDGTYNVNLFDTSGCVYKNEIFNFHVRKCDTIINKYPIIALDTIAIPGTYGVLKASGDSAFNWLPTDGLMCSNCKIPEVLFENNIVYTVSQKDQYNCAFTQNFYVKIRDCDTIILQQYQTKLDTSLIPGNPITLHPSTSYGTYEWLPNPRLSCLDCAEPIYIPGGNEVLYVNLFNSWHCQYTEMFNINNLYISQELVIPDIFTPNGDGINDYFEVKGLQLNTKLKIFNSRGILVYSSSNYQNNWDGTDNSGNALNQDMYYYELKITGEDVDHRGSVFIKR